MLVGRTGSAGIPEVREYVGEAVDSALHVPQTQRRYEAVVDGILKLVEARGLKPGQPLPTERELADVFGVSRNVLRQAFGILEERGLLQTVRGSGRYLREGVDDTMRSPRASVELASIVDLLEARALVEVQVAGLACERRTAGQAESLRLLASRLTSWEDNLAFHCAIAEATQNFVLERLVRQQAELAGQLHQREHYDDPAELERMRSEHLAIAAAIAARDVDRAQRLAREHLRRTRHLILEAPDTDQPE
ncbi:FCD domain-containing protein [Tamaricihabitans halophyticus]|uniref:FadR/GntR family transcriptional regulator n=1 Tax=Tamaricihabitans halophyticus TaxID=1262583 RepID=UPI001404E0FE